MSLFKFGKNEIENENSEQKAEKKIKTVKRNESRNRRSLKLMVIQITIMSVVELIILWFTLISCFCLWPIHNAIVVHSLSPPLPLSLRCVCVAVIIIKSLVRYGAQHFRLLWILECVRMCVCVCLRAAPYSPRWHFCKRIRNLIAVSLLWPFSWAIQRYQRSRTTTKDFIM